MTVDELLQFFEPLLVRREAQLLLTNPAPSGHGGFIYPIHPFVGVEVIVVFRSDFDLGKFTQDLILVASDTREFRVRIDAEFPCYLLGLVDDATESLTHGHTSLFLGLDVPISIPF